MTFCVFPEILKIAFLQFDLSETVQALNSHLNTDNVIYSLISLPLFFPHKMKSFTHEKFKEK